MQYDKVQLKSPFVHPHILIPVMKGANATTMSCDKGLEDLIWDISWSWLQIANHDHMKSQNCFFLYPWSRV